MRYSAPWIRFWACASHLQLSFLFITPQECQDKGVVQKRVKTVLKKLVATGILVAPKAAVGKFKRIDDTSGRGRPKGALVKKGELSERV